MVRDRGSAVATPREYWGDSPMGARAVGMKTSVDGLGGRIKAEGGKARGAKKGRGGDGGGGGEVWSSVCET